MSESRIAGSINAVYIEGAPDASIRVVRQLGRGGTEVLCQPPNAYLVDGQLDQTSGETSVFVRPDPEYAPENSNDESTRDSGVTVKLHRAARLNVLSVVASGGVIELENTIAGRTELTTGEDGEIVLSGVTSTGRLTITGTAPENVRGSAHLHGVIEVNSMLVNALPNVENTIQPLPTIRNNDLHYPL